MAIRVVVFDVSGTTVEDSGAVRTALRDAIAAVGPEVRPGALGGVLGMAKPAALRTLLEGHGRDDLVPQLDMIHADFVRRVSEHYRRGAGVRPVPGVPDALAELARHGIRSALCTGFSRDVLDLVLERVGWTGAGSPFAATIASDEVARGRPWPDMIDALRARLGDVPAADVAKVGDTPVDLQEGTMAGCGLVIGVCTGAHPRSELAQHPHDAILASAADVPSVVLAR